MTDSRKGRLEKQNEDIVINDDFVREDARRIPGQEIDPDSIRPVPLIDEDGELIPPLIDEDDIEHGSVIS